MHDLKDTLCTLQVFQAVAAQVIEGYLHGWFVTEYLMGDLREENLPAVSGGEQAGDTTQCQPKVVAFAQLGIAGMQRHAHMQPGKPTFPCDFPQQPLDFQCRFQRIPRPVEGGAGRITHAFEQVAVMSGDDRFR
ncbi:MAG: hypothetical protein BWY76_00861 [bacterium ADurb.Bin429]|nr:MAG: hypothetical protein BWY76_00861 [bacterium ADurb.Bin429]